MVVAVVKGILTVSSIFSPSELHSALVDLRKGRKKYRSSGIADFVQRQEKRTGKGKSTEIKHRKLEEPVPHLVRVEPVDKPLRFWRSTGELERRS